MSTARSHFRVAGTPVRVEPFFWIVVVLMGFAGREGWSLVLWVAVVFVSILVHELGHAMAYRVFGQRSSIVLHGFGGLTFGQRRLPRFPSIVVSLAGSLSALALLGVPAYLLRESDLFTDWVIQAVRGELWIGWLQAIDDLVFVNIWWSVANLLPIRPLDGGSVTSELVGLDRARKVSIVAAGCAALYAFSQDYSYAGFLAILLGFMNYSEIRRTREGYRGPSTFDVDRPDPGGTTPRSRRGGTAGLRSVPTGPRAARPPSAPASTTGPDREQLELRGWNALRNGDVHGARRVVVSGGDALSPYLRGTVALATGQEDDGLELLADAYRSAPPPNLVPASTVSSAGSSLALAQRLLSRPGGADATATLQTHLHYAERFRDAALVGEALHASGASSDAQTAFEIACAWAREGEVDRAVDWLERAAANGFRAGSLVDTEPDLAVVRSDPRWPVVRASIA